jgi:hypothetical protein
MSHSRDTASCADATMGHRQVVATEVEPPIGIEPMTFRLQGERSTTELRRPAGSEFIGSDDRVVLRSQQAKPPEAVRLEFDLDPALGVELVLRQAVEEVDQC